MMFLVGDRSAIRCFGRLAGAGAGYIVCNELLYVVSLF